MTDFQWFILGVLGIVALVGVHRRHIRYRLIRYLLDRDNDTSPEDVQKIMKAYITETKDGSR